MSPSRGTPQRYSDLAIITVLVIKRVFRITLRAAQGFIVHRKPPARLGVPESF